MRRIAFLGLGKMGAAMAGRLIQAGYDVGVYNRTRAKAAPLARMGARIGASPRAAAEGAEAVFAMVGDDAASRHAWLGRDGALAADLAPKAFVVECSTLSHRWVTALAARAAAMGLRYIDCPVTGVPADAAAGRLILLVGGEKRDLAALRPVLDVLAKETIRFGPVGAGTAYKLMVNLMGSVQIAALAEGLVVAERAGLDRRLVVDALLKGAAASPQVVRNATRMRDGDHARAITFPGKWRLKDTLYGLALARGLGVDARLGAAAAAAFRRQLRAGYGELSESKVLDVVGTRPRRR